MNHEEEDSRSLDRIKTLAEVFTRKREVSDMLNLIGDYSYNIDARVLEPSCGTGNFLVEILERKVATLIQRYKHPRDQEFYLLVALSNLYGVDIDKVNVEETSSRLFKILLEHHANLVHVSDRTSHFADIVSYVLGKNIILGDMINGVGNIHFMEFTSPAPLKFMCREYRFVDLIQASPDSLWGDNPDPIREHKPVHYWELGQC